MIGIAACLARVGLDHASYARAGDVRSRTNSIVASASSVVAKTSGAQEEIDGYDQRMKKQFQLFLDDVRLPSDALVGSEDAALSQLFAGLNPERIMAAASAIGMARFALSKAVDYVTTRTVWKTPVTLMSTTRRKAFGSTLRTDP